ncbi:MAG: TetR/AcrR family transcriptional regulator [Pseudomonadota bacterium]
MTRASTLSPVDWIQAAFRTLTERGIEHVKVEPLARDLGVSKGSFYWHFSDRPALHAAMLQHWKHQATDTIIGRVERAGDDPRTRLCTLITLAAATAPEAYGGAGVESAIRSWARHDADAQHAVAAVDTTRIRYVQGLFRAAGATSARARAMADTVYATLVGLDALPHHSARSRKHALQLVLDGLLETVPTQ